VDSSQPHFDPPDDIPAVSAEELVDGVVEEHQARRYPSTLGGLFYLGVLAASAVGLGLAAAGEWRTGIKVIGCSLLAAAAVRLILSDEDAGMLAVRRKAMDATLLIGLGVLLILLAGSIPNQPG
jgi:hypothetical protein